MSLSQSLLMDVMRILTPEEINKLTTTSEGDKRVSLTDMMERMQSGETLSFAESDSSEGAKILPFKKIEEEAPDEKEEFFAGQKVQEYIEHFFVKQDLNELAANTKKFKSANTSDFIINEKKRFTYSQNKLKGSEVLQLYKKNSNVDIEQEKLLNDDMSKSAQVGVLVNKRQY